MYLDISLEQRCHIFLFNLEKFREQNHLENDLRFELFTSQYWYLLDLQNCQVRPEQANAGTYNIKGYLTALKNYIREVENLHSFRKGQYKRIVERRVPNPLLTHGHSRINLCTHYNFLNRLLNEYRDHYEQVETHKQEFPEHNFVTIDEVNDTEFT